MQLMFSSMALLAGFLLDLLLGDPRHFPHIIRGMGRLIAVLERAFYPMQRKRMGGTLLVICMVMVCTGVPAAILLLAYTISPWLGFPLESIIIWQLLAAKSLKQESKLVHDDLIAGDLQKARHDVSMIVGRDTAMLDDAGVTRAAVETVAENAADGVIAPLFYILLGGGALGCFYKAVNTMDSMIGYKNERYLDFGRTAAKLDDVLNYLPARIAAVLMMIGARLLGLDAKMARQIYRRDHKKHASPNSAHTEAVCAGALHVRLAGDAVYFGKMHPKEYIGDDIRAIEPADIIRANALMMTTAACMLLICLLLRAAVIGGMYYAAV
ncbi:MAG: adenosylcobinamide-phosphate synthase CbiB [Clostridia bacterium]